MNDSDRFQDIVHRIEVQVHGTIQTGLDSVVSSLPFPFRWVGRKVADYAMTQVVIPIDHTIGYIANEIETKTLPDIMADLHFLKTQSSYGKQGIVQDK